MKTCLVSLVSDQTIPNILTAATLCPDYLLFISTAAMEKKHKVECIMNCLKLQGMSCTDRFDKIIVPENDIHDINEKIIEWIKDKRKDYRFTVNLTGGTKLMSLAVYEIFKGYDADIIYIPIPENHYFSVKRPENLFPLTTRLSVESYLAAYGVNISNRNNLDGNEKKAYSRKDTTYFLYENYQELKPLLKAIGSRIREVNKTVAKKGFDLSVSFNICTEIEKKFVKSIGFSHSKSALKKKIYESEWDYLRGGWLEERTFLAVNETLSKNVADVRLKINCKVGRNDNEFDVLFTHNNILYVVECKSLDAPSGSDKKEMGGTVNDFLYKLGAMRQNFGLTPRGILAATSEDIFDGNGKIKGHLIERSRLFNLEIWPLLNVPRLEAWIREKFSDQ